MIDLDFTARFVAGFEGFVKQVYLDAVGVETVGYGETRRDIIERYRRSGISQQDAFDLLKRRVQEFADAVEACITNRAALTPNRHAALTSLAYNIGVGGFRDSTACKRFNAGDIAGVPEAIGWWSKAGGQVFEGLSRRRAAECALFSGAGAPAPDTGAVPVWPGRLLQQGVDGDDVRRAQRRLGERGWRITVDGQFGPKTDATVRKYQGEKALVVDGVIGPTTWQALWIAPITPGGTATE